MTTPADLPHNSLGRGFHYVHHFKCVAQLCADDCCHGWRVMVDRAGFDALQQAMHQSNPEEATFFDQHIRINPDANPQDTTHYAFIPPLANGRCPFLLPDGLCRIVRDYGFEPWSYTCVVYPRKINMVDDTWEVSGFLSCPEMAKHCLLDESASQNFSNTIVLPKNNFFPYHTRMPALALRPFRHHFHALRNTLFHLVGLQHYRLQHRLFLLFALAGRLQSILTEETKTTDFAPHLFFDALEWIQNKQQQQTLILALNQKTAPDKPFHYLLKNLCSEKYRQLIPPLLQLKEPQLVISSYQHICRSMTGKLAARLDLYFTNLLNNYLFANPYDRSSSLAASLDETFLYLTCIRVHLFIHIGPMLEQGHLTSSTLDQAAVDIIQQFSRFAEQSRLVPGLNKVRKKMAKNRSDYIYSWLQAWQMSADATDE